VLLLLAERPEVSITWSHYAPGERGPDLHVHRRHTDAFYVLAGELTFALGPRAERVALTAGGFAAVPPGVVHAFANESGADARFLNFHAPDAGFAGYLRAVRDGTEAAWDSFDAPGDGGRSAAEAIVTGPGEGERLVSGVLKGVLPDLCVAEWAPGPAEWHDRGGAFRVPLDDGRVLTVHAPDAGFADAVRRG